MHLGLHILHLAGGNLAGGAVGGCCPAFFNLQSAINELALAQSYGVAA